MERRNRPMPKSYYIGGQMHKKIFARRPSPNGRSSLNFLTISVKIVLSRRCAHLYRIYSRVYFFEQRKEETMDG